MNEIIKEMKKELNKSKNANELVEKYQTLNNALSKILAEEMLRITAFNYDDGK